MRILTVTICPPENENSTGNYTYVLAMSKSGEDHTPVIEHFLREYQELMKGFKCYFGKTNEIGRMAVSMLTWNQKGGVSSILGKRVILARFLVGQ